MDLDSNTKANFKGAPKEAYAPPDDGIPVGGSPSVEGVMVEAPLEVVVAPSFLTKLASTGPPMPRILDRLLLSSYVPPQPWVHPSTDTVAPDLEGAQEIIDRSSPFNKRDSSVTHMRDLYPTLLRVSAVAHAE